MMPLVELALFASTRSNNANLLACLSSELVNPLNWSTQICVVLLLSPLMVALATLFYILMTIAVSRGYTFSQTSHRLLLQPNFKSLLRGYGPISTILSTRFVALDVTMEKGSMITLFSVGSCG